MRTECYRFNYWSLELQHEIPRAIVQTTNSSNGSSSNYIAPVITSQA